MHIDFQKINNFGHKISLFYLAIKVDNNKMDRSSDPSLVKILISTSEYMRLLHIEKKYLELEKKYNTRSSKNSENLEGKNTFERQDVNCGSQLEQTQNQIGNGQVSNNIANFAKVVAQFMLKENNDHPSTKPESKDLAQEVKQYLQHLFGQNTLGNK
jgi:hypothetical protein